MRSMRAGSPGMIAYFAFTLLSNWICASSMVHIPFWLFLKYAVILFFLPL